MFLVICAWEDFFFKWYQKPADDTRTKRFEGELFGFKIRNITASISFIFLVMKIFILEWDSSGSLGSLQQPWNRAVNLLVIIINVETLKKTRGQCQRKEARTDIPFFLSKSCNWEKLLLPLLSSLWCQLRWHTRLKIPRKNSKRISSYNFVVNISLQLLMW